MSAIPCRSFSDLQARRVSFSEWSGIQKSLVASRPSRIGWDLTKYAEFYQFADVPLSSIERQEARKIIEPFILGITPLNRGLSWILQKRGSLANS